METLWLQRSSSDIPWGFRLQGGREYGTLLQVQRVTPGSVASSGLGPGDTIMKIGNANATGLSHNEGQEIIRNLGNILQLTIKKLSASCQPGPMSPNRYNYDSQVSAQLYEQQQQQQQQQQASPRVQQQQQPVSYGHNLSHDQSDQPYRIQIQHTKTPSYGDTNSYNNRNYVDSSSQQAQSYGSPSYQQDYPTYGRQTSQHNRSQSDNYQSYTPQYNTPHYATQTPQYSTQTSRDNSYGSQQQSTPIKIQFQPNTPQQQQSSFSDGYYGANQTHYGSSQPKSPQSSFQTKAPFSPGGSPYYTEEVQSPSYKSPILPGGGTLNRSLSQEQQNQSSPYSPGQYSTLSPTGTYSRNASSDYNQTDYSQTFPRSYSRQSSQPQQSSPYVSEQSQYGSPAKPTFSPSGPSSYNRSTSQQGQTYADMLQQEQPSSSATTTATFSPTRQQIQMNPLSPSSPSYGGQKQPSFLNQQPSYGTQSPQPAYGSQQPSFLNQQPAYGAQSQQPSYGSQQPSYGVQAQPSYGSQPPTPQAVPAAPQYTPPAPAVPAAPAAPPVADFTAFNNSYSPSRPGYGVSPDLSSLSLDSFSTDQDPYSQSQLTEPISVAPPAPPAPDLFIPPPPPPPSGPPPPPPPPIPGSLADWRPDDQKSGSGSTNKQDGPKVPDGLISAMNKPGKKPFSYGIDLNELKQRTSRQSSSGAPKKKPVAAPAVGPPSTAPKPGMAKTNVMPGGPPGSGETYKNQSETLRMVQERDASKYQPQSEIDESHIHVNPHGAKGKQSLSFKVLQWMTDTDANEKVEEVPAQPERPKKQRNPLLRHNSEDDEMRFSGLHSKADIPSKAFGRLNSMTSHVDSPPQNTQNDNDGEEEVGNYDQTSIRYKGKFIPSPSFRVLQNWAALDTDVETPAQRRANKGDDEDDGLPDTLSNEEMVDVRYKGGHIPSKVFRSLQKAVGDDTPENAQPVSQNGIKVIKAAPPTTVTKDNAGTDF